MQVDTGLDIGERVYFVVSRDTNVFVDSGVVQGIKIHIYSRLEVRTEYHVYNKEIGLSWIMRGELYGDMESARLRVSELYKAVV